jgi:hypothetical protein
MNTAESPEKRLELVYKYFSHHMRTNTAVIVAMLEAINEGLSDESMTEMVMESGYLLDLFDRGMSVCFNHLFDKKESSEPEQIELLTLVNLFISNAVTKDGTISTNINIPSELKVTCEPYAFKSLVQIFLHETALVTQESFSVEFADNVITMTPDGGFFENPEVFQIFADLLAKQNIKLEYDNVSIRLRLIDESINC